jgi:hypothetical protein
MEYTKPVIVAQNNKNGSFAAGCPANNNCQGGGSQMYGNACKKCERTK